MAQGYLEELNPGGWEQRRAERGRVFVKDIYRGGDNTFSVGLAQARGSGALLPCHEQARRSGGERENIEGKRCIQYNGVTRIREGKGNGGVDGNGYGEQLRRMAVGEDGTAERGTAD